MFPYGTPFVNGSFTSAVSFWNEQFIHLAIRYRLVRHLVSTHVYRNYLVLPSFIHHFLEWSPTLVIGLVPIRCFTDSKVHWFDDFGVGRVYLVFFTEFWNGRVPRFTGAFVFRYFERFVEFTGAIFWGRCLPSFIVSFFFRNYWLPSFFFVFKSGSRSLTLGVLLRSLKHR